MERKILILGLNEKITKPIAQKVADCLDRFFMDVEDLIAYSLQDEKHIKSLVGVEYYNKEVKKLIFSLCSYENIVVNCPYEFLLDDEIYNELKQHFEIVYINLLKGTLKKLNSELKSGSLDTTLFAYKELSTVCKERANYVITAKHYDIDLITDSILNL